MIPSRMITTELRALKESTSVSFTFLDLILRMSSVNCTSRLLFTQECWTWQTNQHYSFQNLINNLPKAMMVIRYSGNCQPCKEVSTTQSKLKQSRIATRRCTMSCKIYSNRTNCWVARFSSLTNLEREVLIEGVLWCVWCREDAGASTIGKVTPNNPRTRLLRKVARLSVFTVMMR